jgi:hypothetical protein
MVANDGEQWRPEVASFSQISVVFSTRGDRSRTGKWCPEEDSNLHGLATAST